MTLGPFLEVGLRLAPLVALAYLAKRPALLGALRKERWPGHGKVQRKAGLAYLSCLPDPAGKPCRVYDSQTLAVVAAAVTAAEATELAERAGYEVVGLEMPSEVEVVDGAGVPTGRDWTTDRYTFVKWETGQRLLAAARHAGPVVQELARQAKTLASPTQIRRKSFLTWRGEGYPGKRTQYQLPTHVAAEARDEVAEALAAGGLSASAREALLALKADLAKRAKVKAYVNRDDKALRENAKTVRSFDVTLICPRKRGGKACSYCYVEAGRAAAEYATIQGKRGPMNPVKCLDQLHYNGEVRRLRPETIAKLRAAGGIRMFSQADWYDTPYNRAQTCRFLDDCAAMGLRAKAITKQADFVRLFHDHPALSVVNLSVDSTGESLRRAQVEKLQARYPKVVSRAVVLTPEQLEQLAWVDVLTLYHADDAISDKLRQRGYHVWQEKEKAQVHADRPGQVCCTGNRCTRCSAMGGPQCAQTQAQARLATAGALPAWECPVSAPLAAHAADLLAADLQAAVVAGLPSASWRRPLHFAREPDRCPVRRA